jgi:hypothetical protein
MIKKLYIFDFDGTLFKSPPPPKYYDGAVDDWYRDELSLSPPMVPTTPDDSWFFTDIASLALKASRCRKTYSVLMSGRRGDISNFYSRIRNIIYSKNIRFDEICLKPRDMMTIDFKSDAIFQIASRIERENIGLEEIHIYDDRHHHLPVFEKKLRLSKAKIHTYPVGTPNTSG